MDKKIEKVKIISSIFLAFILLILTYFNYDREIEYSLKLNETYKSKSNELYLSDDGTFTLKECKDECITYTGVIDHADNGLLFYFDDGQIKEGNVIKNNVVKLEKIKYYLNN